MEVLIYIIAGSSLLTFILFALDKMFARMGSRRVPEAVLLWFSFCGGAAGALCAMNMFHHKTQKKKFMTNWQRRNRSFWMQKQSLQSN